MPYVRVIEKFIKKFNRSFRRKEKGTVIVLPSLMTTDGGGKIY